MSMRNGINQKRRCGRRLFLHGHEVLQQLLKDRPELLDLAAVDLVEQGYRFQATERSDAPLPRLTYAQFRCYFVGGERQPGEWSI